MTDRCMHGFEVQTCASCRRCQHGILESRCGICAPRTAREAAVRLANDGPQPSESYRGYEISYAPGERSWYIAAPEAPRSQNSFRSAFMARRAIDAILDAPAPVKSGGKSRKG